MPTTIRKIEPSAYRRLKARAALQGKTVGEALTEAILAYTEEPPGDTKKDRERDGRSSRKAHKGKAPKASRQFTRPPPDRGEFVDDPLVIIELKPGE